MGNSTRKIPVETTISADDTSSYRAIIIELKEEEKKAYVTIEKTDSYPACDDVVDALKAADIPYWIDKVAIQKELERGVTNNPFVAAFAKDGALEVKIKKNTMPAYLTLTPAYGGKDITLDDAQEKIQQAGITFGVDHDTAHYVFSENVYDKPVLFAKGKEPIHRIDARIEYDFPLEFKISPKELEHNKVDYRELQMIFAVNKGDTLTRKIPPTSGEPGCTITGKTIPAKPGKDVKLAAGRNAALSNDEWWGNFPSKQRKTLKYRVLLRIVSLKLEEIFLSKAVSSVQTKVP